MQRIKRLKIQNIIIIYGQISNDKKLFVRINFEMNKFIIEHVLNIVFLFSVYKSKK